MRAEDYGSVKLELIGDSEALVELYDGSEIEFSRLVDTEKQIKSWLLNGTHWLIALNAVQESRGDRDMKLNEFLLADPRQLAFARTAMAEMNEGVAILLRGDDRFGAFVDDTDVDAYQDGAATAILSRFCATEDPITRILARFRAPTPGSMDTVVNFSERSVHGGDADGRLHRRTALPQRSHRALARRGSGPRDRAGEPAWGRGARSSQPRR